MRRVVYIVGTVAFGVATLAPTAFAQSGAQILAVATEPVATALPRNTPVYLTLNETLNTKSSTTKRGNTFTLSVEQNVLFRRHIVIPRGSKAVGTIVKRSGKGGFGRSGKLDISLDYIEVGDNRIPIEGHFREEGEGNSTATVATFVFISMLGSGLITGHSAEIEAGRRFTVWTKEDVPVQMPDGRSAELAAVPGVAPATLIAQSLPGAATHSARPAVEPRFGNNHVRCETCR